MTKIVLPQKKQDGLNGWQTMENVPEDQTVDLIDRYGHRHTDCLFTSLTDWYGNIDEPCWCVYKEDSWLKVSKPLYWMAR